MIKLIKNRYLKLKQMSKNSNIKSPIKCYLYQRVPKTNKDIIIYCCTFNGNALEGNFLINFFASSFDFLFFDSRGLGLNQSKYVTLGLREAEDLDRIINKLL